MSNDMKTTKEPRHSSSPSSSSSPAPYVCNVCKNYLAITSESITDGKNSATSQGNSTNPVCSVCQDLWKSNSPALKSALEQACQSYGGMEANHFSKSSITISLPGELNLNYRYRRNRVASGCAKPFAYFLKQLKLFLVEEIQKLCTLCHKQSPPPPILKVQNSNEEQGFLSIHLQCIPPKTTERPALVSSKQKKKRQRWRPFVTQGGDPRVNLESRLEQHAGRAWHRMSDAENMNLQQFEPPTEAQTMPMEYHFAVFRNPIFIYGYYTKSRRDVSQSPFVVMREQNENDGETGTTPHGDGTHTQTDNQEQPPPSKKKRKKVAETLGVTSVEEQITNPIVEILGGISIQNNLSSPLPSQSNDRNPSAQGTSSNVQYGMCKFHASGREDMDVRMLIRPGSNTCGRPFCVQLIDAKRALETEDQLKEIVNRINCTKGETGDSVSNTESNADDDSKCRNELWHGQNPLGVGICPDKLQLVPASAYSNLQADTETKVKHYGCHCWSEQKLPQVDEGSDSRITTQLFPNLNLPLTIQQKTPLRVVHRRANLIRERQILQLEAWRVDDHHFRLELSTQAGTYVKEFVHGDLRRTQPSIGSLMGCQTNLLLLDCEGIELAKETAN